jgi:hypothetical protein
LDIYGSVHGMEMFGEGRVVCAFRLMRLRMTKYCRWQKTSGRKIKDNNSLGTNSTNMLLQTKKHKTFLPRHPVHELA